MLLYAVLAKERVKREDLQEVDEAIELHLRRTYDREIDFQVIRKEGPAPLTSDRTPMFALLADEAKRAYGAPVGTEILNRWFNDSRFLRKRGIAAYGIDPFPVDYFQSETIHQPNERIRVDYFQQGVEFLRRVVAKYAFAK